MLNTVSIYTELKNTDLHAMSAAEALVDLMGVSNLKRLKRYQHWRITLEGDIQNVLKNSYAIVNVNKEHFRVGDMPAMNVSKGAHGFRFEVQPVTPVDRSGLAKSLSQKSGVKVHDVAKTLVWEIVLESAESRAAVEQTLVAHILNTTSRTQGLLVNPILETVQLLDHI